VHTSTVRFPLLDYKGDATGVCTISRDVTAEKRMQRDLANASKLAAIGKLAAGIAHEINNPLTGVLAFAEDLIEDSNEDDPKVEDYRVIVRETMRCREIVRNLLDFARQTRPHARQVNLNEVVTAALRLVERLPSFRDIELTCELADDLPTIYGDPQQLQQVVLNLLVNAAEAMEGEGRIRVGTDASPADGTAQVRVLDDGPGIPEEDRERIFEPFFSTKSTTHGLGLAVSWGIVERHGGRIDLCDRPGGGTVFTVVLPTTGV
jgi:two-component system NtrC family sensor kinase